MSLPQIHRTIEAIWKMESPKLIARLTHIVKDVSLAEDIAQDALVTALEKWEQTGMPENPGAWLMTTAKHRAIDLLRRNKVQDQKYAALAENTALFTEESFSEEIGDDLLRLIFMTCHPALSQDASAAMTLRLLCGLTTKEIARSFLTAEATIAQRIVRAKKTLKEKKVPFEIPAGEELKPRLSSVLEVIYLMFNEGYTATSGSQWTRPLLCREALRLGRVLAEIAPEEPEVHGLVSLMEFQFSRVHTRVNKNGEPILLTDQKRSQWDQLLIRRGTAALERSRKLGGTPGPYALQASISACHALAPSVQETDWTRIAALYEALFTLLPSPIVELNRAVAISMAFGPAVGMQMLDELSTHPSLKNYHLLPSVRGDLLVKLGRNKEARLEFERAALLTQNEREKTLLQNRAKECSKDPAP
ncbi:RNA polymerase sigma factor [Alkalicoccus daliensis]|uniref:RNA polymerase sigma factor, sigma-70 family n=1 Tax=Alkalicoccus daliensis TaxID=745820 RepID=A0A1H0E7D5_9BACI|nr:RNA polymerase sigma factor [Alkalicoccus daliensis]SDN78243.1 RNA polymerase sigma factor, sigma-70 family [Alkalicoccus daliensis]